MTQKATIMQYLLDNPGGITSKEAFEKFGITRLADIVYKLRKEMAIRDRDETCITRLGSKATYSRYYIASEDIKKAYGK